MEKKCQIGAVGDPRGKALDVLLVGQCVLDSKDAGPRVSLQEEVVDVESERLAHLLDLAHGGSSGWSADVCVLLVCWVRQMHCGAPRCCGFEWGDRTPGPARRGGLVKLAAS